MTSGTLAAVTVADNGTPRASVITWCLLPDLPRSVGFGPVSSPPSGALAKEASISARPQSIWSAAVEFCQQHRVQLPPDTGLMPDPQVVAAGLAAAAAEFGGQVIPGDAGLEDEQDAGEDLAVVQGLAAREAEAAWGWGWQQGPETLPQRIGDEGFHGLSSFGSGDHSPKHKGAASVPVGSFFPNALRLARLLNSPRIRWVANHNVPACRDLERIGVNPQKIVPWDWLQSTSPDMYDPKPGPSNGAPWHLVFVGGVSELKGVGDAIDAVAELKRRGRDVELNIIGQGDVDQLSARARDAGVAERSAF